MKFGSAIAIYFITWWVCLFIVLPFGVKTAEEAGVEKVPGQADSAPVNFRPGKLALRAAIIAAVCTGLFVANYEYGWVTVADIDILPKPPAATTNS